MYKSAPVSWCQWRLKYFAFLALLPSHIVRASLHLLSIDGLVNGDVHGYGGMVWQAIRYEPLCGHIVSDGYNNAYDLSERCIPAIESFTNNTKRSSGIYDLTGARLENARVGGGYDVCMCVVLLRIKNNLKVAICLWVDGTGRLDDTWTSQWGYVDTGSLRPNAENPVLPQCSEADVSALRASWSATAVQPSFFERVTTPSPPRTNIVSITSTKVITISVAAYTTMRTIVTTDANGSPTTQITTQTTQAAIVTVQPEKKGLDRGEKIALGVGLGIGLPTIFLMIVGLCMRLD